MRGGACERVVLWVDMGVHSLRRCIHPSPFPLSISPLQWEEALYALRDDPVGRETFLASGSKSALPRAIVTSYKELELIHYFTAGEKVCAERPFHCQLTLLRRHCFELPALVISSFRRCAAGPSTRALLPQTPRGPSTPTSRRTSLRRRCAPTTTSSRPTPPRRALRPSRRRARCAARAGCTWCRTVSGAGLACQAAGGPQFRCGGSRGGGGLCWWGEGARGCDSGPRSIE